MTAHRAKRCPLPSGPPPRRHQARAERPVWSVIEAKVERMRVWNAKRGAWKDPAATMAQGSRRYAGHGVLVGPLDFDAWLRWIRQAT